MKHNSQSIGKRVSVVVLSWNSIHHMEMCMKSLQNQTYQNLKICLYDQASTDGTVEYVKKHFPKVEITVFPENLAYARGNNLAMEKEFNAGADFCILLNDDTESDPDMVTSLIKTYQNGGSSIGLVQPVVLLYEDRKIINTIGNAIHYLGFGYCKDYKKQYRPLEKDKQILSASGVALLVSKEYYSFVGSFDEDFFMYMEDENYSWRGLLKGKTHILSSQSLVYHKYSFKRNEHKIYHAEKNRIMIVLENYTLKTLVYMIPILIVNEVIAVTYSIFGGYFRRKMSSYAYILTHLKEIFKKRRIVQKTRIVNDKIILRRFESDLLFEEMKNPLLLYIVNPLYRLYYKLLVVIA